VACTAISIVIANSGFGHQYLELWHSRIDLSFGGIDLNLSLEQWVNDFLMAIFFLMVGLEIERELYVGELSDFKSAILPVMAAIGGMIIPAGIHLFFNYGQPTESGAGIPMATDIAFALGILSLLGNKVPYSLKVFLAAFAIIDDLGAVIIIAIFYSKSISLLYLAISLVIFLAMVIINRYKIFPIPVYILIGLVLWYCMLHSGVHATISGVLLAFAIPFRKAEENNISIRLQRSLHKPVAFFILPLFALANTAIIFEGSLHQILTTPNSLGVLLGLILGKPVGIVLFTLFTIMLGWSAFPESMTRKHLVGLGILGGIGFTMSIFIANLAFDDAVLIQHSKIAILSGSALSAVAGLIWLRFSTAVDIKTPES